MIKTVNIDKEDLHIFQTTWNFNEVFRKNMSHNNIKNHKKPGPYSFSKKQFWKNNRCGHQIDLPAFLGLMIILLYEYNFRSENLFFFKEKKNF